MKSGFQKIATYGTVITLLFTVICMTPGLGLIRTAAANSAQPLGGALEITQQGVRIKSTIAAAAGVSTAGSTAGLLAKENLDGIAWSIAKQMVSNMTKSMVNWINSGFEGKPAFVTDLKGMLNETLDTTFGEYIKSLGGIGEFICSPFKLDVQAALAINYQQARTGMPSGPTACKLTDIKDNIENFMAGSMSDWGQWVSITSNPQNTPYGAYLEAEAKLNLKLQNEAGAQLIEVNWSQGFLSKKICEGVNGQPAETGVNCKITTPGKVISDALTFQLSTGPQALIQADEVNEVIGALINQLTLQAMQGANGLLGLGGNSNYTDYSYGNGGNTQSYIDAAAAEQDQFVDTSSIRTQMGTALETEISYTTLASTTLALALIKLGPFAVGPTLDTLLGNTTVRSIGITPGSTLIEAETKLDAAYAASSVDITTLDYIKAQLTVIRTAISILESNNTDLNDLDTVPFSTLKTEGAAAQGDLTALVSETTRAKNQAIKNVALLNKLIASYDNASSSATVSTTASAIRQKAALDFIGLVQGGVLTSAVVVDTKRLDWTDRLK